MGLAGVARVRIVLGTCMACLSTALLVVNISVVMHVGKERADEHVILFFAFFV